MASSRPMPEEAPVTTARGRVDGDMVRSFTRGVLPERRQRACPRTVPTMENQAFRERRARLARAMQAAGGGVAVVPTALEQVRNGDNTHAFRPDSTFHYLTGFGEPHAW